MSPYYLGTRPYVSAKFPGKVLCIIRNRMGWRVVLDPEDAKLLAPYDLYQDKAKTIWCQNVLGKRVKLTSLITGGVEVTRDVVQVTP